MSPPNTQSQEMPFQVAVIFTVIGATVLTGLLGGWVVPAAWVTLAYKPTEAVAVDRQLVHVSSGKKGDKNYKLEVQLAFKVKGQEHRGWTRLPLIAKDTLETEMDAVLAQV